MNVVHKLWHICYQAHKEPSMKLCFIINYSLFFIIEKNSTKYISKSPTGMRVSTSQMPKATVVKIRLSKAQLNKVKYGNAFRIKPEDVGHAEGHSFPSLGRHNRVLLSEAKTTGKPVKIVLMDEELEGSGLKEFFQGVGRFFKKNWSTIKPIVSTVLDVGAPALAKAFPEASPAILSGRQLIKKTTGVGATGGSFKAKGITGGRLKKGSPEAKAYMAQLRARRSHARPLAELGRGQSAKKAKGGKVSVMNAGSFLSY